MRYRNLYLKYLQIHLNSLLQYKTSFVFTIVGQFLTSFTALIGVIFMFDRFHEVEGFSLEEVLLCLAVVLMAFSLAECFCRGFDIFPRLIGNGKFDRLLLRPRSLIFQLLTEVIEFSRLGRMIQALFVFVYAIPSSGVNWNPTRVALLIVMILCGAALFFFLFLLYASISFYTLDSLEFMNIFTDGAREFGRYPFSIYGRHVLRFLTFVIPMALFQYYPLLYLLGREDHIIYLFAPLLSLLFGIPVYGFWRFSLRHFHSTGS